MSECASAKADYEDFFRQKISCCSQGAWSITIHPRIVVEQFCEHAEVRRHLLCKTGGSAGRWKRSKRLVGTVLVRRDVASYSA